MFPIPFNFPFRKKDGTITTMDDAISSGGGGEPYILPTASANTKGGIKIGNRLTMNGEVLSADAQIPTYTESDNGKVLTVNDSGELEWDTKGSGGGNYVMSWDFTKFGNITRDFVTFSSNGATFDNTRSCLPLFGSTSGSSGGDIKDITIYVNVTSQSLTSGSHKRFIMATTDSGLIYRGTGVWGFYSGSWEDSQITDGDYFSNSKIKIYVDSNSKWHIYKNNVLIFEPATALLIRNLIIGSTSDAINSGVLTGVRIYNGNYTET